jgi:hypothetical protein
MRTIQYFLFCFAALVAPASAQTTISALTAASALTGVEAFPCVQSATTKKFSSDGALVHALQALACRSILLLQLGLVIGSS